MSTVRIRGNCWGIPVYMVDYIVLSQDKEFYQVYLSWDEAGNPSYEVPSGKTMTITEKDYIIFK